MFSLEGLEHAVWIGAREIGSEPWSRILWVTNRLHRSPMLEGSSVGIHSGTPAPIRPAAQLVCVSHNSRWRPLRRGPPLPARYCPPENSTLTPACPLLRTRTHCSSFA